VCTAQRNKEKIINNITPLEFDNEEHVKLTYVEKNKDFPSCNQNEVISLEVKHQEGAICL